MALGGRLRSHSVVREVIARLSSVQFSSAKGPAIGRRTSIKWMLIVAVAAILPYIDTLRGGFVLDDWPLIVYSPVVRNLDVYHALITRFLPESFGPQAVCYRPLITLSYIFNFATTGLNPLVFHLTNVLLNALVAVMVYLLARRLGACYAAAGIAGIAFSVLPSHGEVVAWISGRTDIFCALFMLGSLLVFITNHQRKQGFSWLLAVLCSVLFTGALFSKEGSMVLPILMLGYVVIFGDWKRPKEALKWAAVLIPPLVVYLVLRKHVMGTALDANATLLLKERLLGVGVVYASYMRMMFWPQELHLIYDIFPVVGRYPAVAYLAWSIPVGLVALTVLVRKRLPILAFASFWMLINLLPVSNIIPIYGPLPAERFVYLASVASSILIGLFVWKLYELRPKSIRVWPFVVAMLAGGYFLYSAAYVVHGSRYYCSDIAWAQGIVDTQTRFAMFRYTAAQTFENAGMLDDAIREYETALELDEGELQSFVRADVEYRLGLCYVQTGDLIGAADAFARSADIAPSNGKAWRNYGRAKLELRDYPEAVRGYEQAFKLFKPKPRDHYELGLAYKATGNLQMAEQHFRSAAKGKPADQWTRQAQKELDSTQQ